MDEQMVGPAEPHGPSSAVIDGSGLACPKCGKQIVSKDFSKSSADGRVIRARLVFFGKDNTITGKCGGCGAIIGLPFKIMPTGGAMENAM